MSPPPTPGQRAAPRYRLTGEGRIWLAATAIFWATGIFKGINLITLLGSFMLATWSLNVLSVRRRFRRLEVRRRIDKPVFAGTPVAVEVEVENMGRKAVMGLRLEARGPVPGGSSFIPELGGGATARLRYMIALPRRGWYALEPAQAASGHPFGLIERRMMETSAESVIVFPQLGRLHRRKLRRFLTQAVPSLGQTRRPPIRHPLAQDQVHGVRSFRSGDSPRWIHWRTSARRGELMVREFDDMPTDNLILVVDPWVPSETGSAVSTDGGPDAGERSKAGEIVLEDAFSLAATICWDWCRKQGDRLVLAAAGRTPVLVAGETSRDFAFLLLEYFAVQRGYPMPDEAGLLDRLCKTALPPAPVLLVSTRSRPTLREGLAARLRRPVACIEVPGLDRYDFYERPGPHAA
jgi:uncharacterized protein (DUF58 family)